MTRCNLCGRDLARAPMHVILCTRCEERVPNARHHLEATLAASKALTAYRRFNPGTPSPAFLRDTLFRAYGAFRLDICRVRKPSPRDLFNGGN